MTRESRPRCSPLLRPAPSNDVTAVVAVCGPLCCCCSCRCALTCSASYQPAAQPRLSDSVTAKPLSLRSAAAPARASYDATAVAPVCGSRCCCCCCHCGPHFSAPATSQPHGHSHTAARRPSRPCCSPLLPRLRVSMAPRRWRRCEAPAAAAAAAAVPSLAAPATSQPHSHARRTAR